MKERILTAVYRSASKRKLLTTAMLTLGAFVAVIEPAAARVTANHNETLLSDAG